MPALGNPRHERFAQELAKGRSASEAYREAGYSTKANSSGTSAHRLKNAEKVKNRVQELQERASQRAEITYAEHIERLAELRDIAVERDQLGAAIQAEVSRGKAAGYYVDRSQTEHRAQLIVKDLTKQINQADRQTGETIEAEDAELIEGQSDG